MDLSVIVPVYNEEENVEPIVEEIGAALGGMGKSFEVIVVDDGSRDDTFPILCRLHQQRPWLKIIRFKRNFGQTAAIAAGLAHARGSIVVPMDGDGQNDPEDIPGLVQKLDEGYDLVSGWRYPRQDPFWSRRLPSEIANWVISWITGVKLHDYGCTLKAMREEIAKDLKLYGEMHRFIPALAKERGASVAEVRVNHRPRLRGRSKYGLSRTFRVLLDLVTVQFLNQYATRPLHVFGVIGLGSGLAGLLIGVYLSLQKILYGADIGGRPLLLLAVLLIVISFQFFSIGLLGEMLARTYHESQSKTIYVIRDIVEQPGDT
ncbi:MAG: glycosyltransferase family 2 protein [Candidatus Binatia bacterium]